ncbi:hypothetical protein ACOZ4I_17765 (plasmid) [Haloarcula salina]|uniref:hypothetical protein n=1 Tax=Haloarcula salina TaxID=1429914 RepID=UPI003C6FA3F7
MKAAISLTDNGSRNFTHALICARRMDDDEAIEDVCLIARGEGVELFDTALDPELQGELSPVMDGDVTCKVSYPCVESREMDLVDGVEPVESGAIELLEMQSEGYDLIKVP